MIFDGLKKWFMDAVDDEDLVAKETWFEPVKGAPKDTILPKRSTSGSAGYDFFAPKDIFVPAHGFSELVPFNVKAHMHHELYLGIVIRSSLATTKAHLEIAQGSAAIIDSDYFGNPNNDGNIGIMFHNRDDKDYLIHKGDKCCQGIFQEYFITKDDSCTAKRVGGYGSTGTK